MGIQPIDLQTLYTQLDKVGKTQLAQQHAVQNAQDSQMAANRLKADHNLKSVQETEAGSEKPGKVHDREAGTEEQGSEADKKKPDEGLPGADTTPARTVITDPALGNRIDISG